MSNPPPRPVLRRASDSEVSPARVTSTPTWAKDSDAASTSKGKSADKKKGKGKKAGGAKTAAIELPKKLSKQLNARATSLGYNPSDVVEMLVRGWLDG